MPPKAGVPTFAQPDVPDSFEPEVPKGFEPPSPPSAPGGDAGAAPAAGPAPEQKEPLDWSFSDKGSPAAPPEEPAAPISKEPPVSPLDAGGDWGAPVSEGTAGWGQFKTPPDAPLDPPPGPFSGVLPGEENIDSSFFFKGEVDKKKEDKPKPDSPFWE